MIYRNHIMGSKYINSLKYYIMRIYLSMSFSVLVIGFVLLFATITVGSATAIFPISQEHNVYLKETALKMLEQATEDYGTDPEKAVAAIHDAQDPRFQNNGMYVFVINNNGTIMAHGLAPYLVGDDISHIYDTTGISIGELIQNSVSPYGQWIQYYWPHADLNVGELNAVFVRTHWDHTFGVGIQLGSIITSDVLLSEQDQDRQRMAQNIVDAVISDYTMYTESVIADIHDQDDQQFRDDEIYAFIYAANGTIIAHGGMPHLAGTDSQYLQDGFGANMHDLIVEDISPYGKWIEYWWPNPVSDTNEDELKFTWVRSHGGYIFGAGMYPEAPDDEIDDQFSWRDKEHQQVAQDMVDGVIRHINADLAGVINAINDKGPTYQSGSTFVIVADASGSIVAHGQDASWVGSDMRDLHGTDGTSIGDLYLENASPHGRWVEYDTTGDTLLAFVKSTGLYTVVAVMYPEMVDQHEEPLTHHQIERQQVAKDMVRYTIEAFALDSMRTISEIHDPDNVLYQNDEIFVFIVNTNGTVLAHGGDPDIRGSDTEFLTDSRGAGLDDIWLEHVTPYGKWIEYYWPNPVKTDNTGELKWTWTQLWSEYVFGAGMYPEYTEDLYPASDPPSPYFTSSISRPPSER